MELPFSFLIKNFKISFICWGKQKCKFVDIFFYIYVSNNLLLWFKIRMMNLIRWNANSYFSFLEIFSLQHVYFKERLDKNTHLIPSFPEKVKWYQSWTRNQHEPSSSLIIELGSNRYYMEKRLLNVDFIKEEELNLENLEW